MRCIYNVHRTNVSAVIYLFRVLIVQMSVQLVTYITLKIKILLAWLCGKAVSYNIDNEGTTIATEFSTVCGSTY